jgi:hypothetical protein
MIFLDVLMQTDHSNSSRIRHLRAIKGSVDGSTTTTQAPAGQILVVGLGDRMVISEQAEIWTLRGVLHDGRVLDEAVGEMSFVMIPGQYQPATAVVGYIAPPTPHVLGVGEDSLWPQLRAMISQLGYDLDGFYVSMSIDGKAFNRREMSDNSKGRK